MKDLVQERQHKAEKVSWLLQVVPFIRFVGLTGSLAYEVARRDSDIDLFIIAKHGRIWTCRFFVTVLLKILGLYRSGDEPSQRAGKICPNRYVSDKYLLINPQNRYHAQEYTQMISLYDSDGVYKRFREKNQWMGKYGYFEPKRANIEIQSAVLIPKIRNISEFILRGNLGDWLEIKLKNFQLKNIMKDKRVNQPDSGLYVDNNELRFHPRPR